MMRRYLKLFSPAAAAAAIALPTTLSGGVVLAALACVPILLSSAADSRWQLLATGGVALAGFAAGSGIAFARGGMPASGIGAWLLVWLALVLATALAFWLQKRRLEALMGRDAAQAASEMNRLLMSLLAHDLRAPLSLADQGFQYVEEATSGGYLVDRALVADVRARLQRSLRAIEMVLSLASTRSGVQSRSASDVAAVHLPEEIGTEVASFRYEAEARGKQLVGELDAVHPPRQRVNVLVLRQAIAIAIDNAIRYADPGPIHVSASVERSTLEVRVTDSGPGLSAHRTGASHSGGSGLGLRLCSTLLARAGGSLHVERDAPDGTTLLIRLPTTPLPAVPIPDSVAVLSGV